MNRKAGAKGRRAATPGTRSAARSIAPAREPERRRGEKTGWQAQKSAMTRESILDAAVECFVHNGYATTTTANIADSAGVSRGAMLHHFASKTELVQAAVEHLHHKLLDLYFSCIAEITHDLGVDERNRRGLLGYWKYLSSDLFITYHELCVAARNDPEMQRILEGSIRRFDLEVKDANEKLFPEWSGKGELFDFAMDITKFVMEGMATSQIVENRDKRIRRMIDYLGDRLEEIFHEGDADTAILRHASRPAPGARRRQGRRA
jgi:AcrR family transcriptional regulator